MYCGAAFATASCFSSVPVYAAEPNFYFDFRDITTQYSYAFGVSGDGAFVVGASTDGLGDTDAFRWSTTTGDSMDLGRLNNGFGAQPRATNSDGSVVVGIAADGARGNAATAFRWTASNNEMVSLGTLNGGVNSFALDVSADGSTVVGYATDGITLGARAFRWTEASAQMVGLGTLNNGTNSYGTGVSADGRVVVGYANDGASSNELRAFRWTEASNIMVSLGVLPGGDYSVANDVNSDGTIIVGAATDGELSGTYAFRWSEATGAMQSLGRLAGHRGSGANGVSYDGAVVVGYSTDMNSREHAFRWSEATGMISVEDWLRSNGVAIANDSTEQAYGTNADGSIVVGTTNNGSAFIARVSSVGSGIIDVNEFYTSLANKPGANVGLNFANTVLHGAHGEPMRNLLDVGQQSIWVTNDTGYDNGASSDGAFGLVDFGYGLGLEGGATARFAFGGLYSDQDIDAGGNFINKGFYIAPEVSLPVAGNVYATIGGYYAPGKLSVTRGYLNGGVMDYSHGEADLDTWGAKLRFDWLNAFSANDWNFTPYTSLTYMRSKLDAYTETGGGFPASFNQVKDHNTVLRVGLDGVHSLTNDIRLLTRAEAAYRFESETAATSGSITGLSGFSFDGQETNQFWLRGGLGAEMDVAGGTASLNVNVTTQGDDPTVWVRSGWKVKF